MNEIWIRLVCMECEFSGEVLLNCREPESPTEVCCPECKSTKYEWSPCTIGEGVAMLKEYYGKIPDFGKLPEGISK